MENNQPIGIFDSGIGGFTVFSQIAKILPNENIIYFADNKNNPFGDKSTEEILAINDNIINYFLKCKVKLIVIACNTSSALAIDHNKINYDVPFIDMLNDGLSFFKDISHRLKLGIIATQATVNSKSYLRILSKYNSLLQVTQLATPELVPLIEAGNEEGIKKSLTKYMQHFQEIDSLLYGCSHYPHIDKFVKELYPTLDTIDPAKHVAIRVYEKLANIGFSSEKKENKLCYTKEQINLIEHANNLGFSKFIKL
jgi:glutamate racemase